jgi:4-hydroxybenzoate polyprenyltransferase
MKLTDALLLSLIAGLVIITIHQAMTVGIAEAYWIAMVALAFLFYYQYRKRKE